MLRGMRMVGFIVLLCLVWEICFRLDLWEPYLFPSPFQVFNTLVTGIGDTTFLLGIGISLWRLFQGYLISVVVGVTLGAMIGRTKLLEDTLGALLLGLQTLPSICWLPLALLWFGLGDQAVIFVVVMGGTLAVAISTDAGVRCVQPIYLRAARTMGADGFRLYYKVILPAALPGIITGMKLGWSFSWRSLMAGELLVINGGLGQLLMMGREFNDMSQVLAVMVVIIALGLCMDRLVFGKLDECVRRRWGLHEP